MTDDLPNAKHAALIDLASRLDRYGAKMLGPETHATNQAAARILSTPGAAMTLTLRVDDDAITVELAASSARGGRVVVAAHSALRQGSTEL